MNELGIVAALAAEARTLGRAGRSHRSVRTLPDGAYLAVGGIGPAAAALAARRLVEAGATALLSWGMAGGLDPGLSPGTLVLPSEVISDDGASLPTAPAWRERLIAAVAAVAAEVPISRGRLLTSALPIASAAAKAAAFRATGAVAVDMESLAVAEVALLHRLPFLAVRVIVDAAGDSLPRAVEAASRGGPLRLWRLFGGLAAAPARAAELIPLARRYRAARRALVAVANTGLLRPPVTAAPAGDAA